MFKLIALDVFDKAQIDDMYKIISSNMKDISDFPINNNTYSTWVNNCLKDKDIKTIVIYSESILIGYLQYKLEIDYVLLSEVQVDKEHQGKEPFKVLIAEFTNRSNINASTKVICHINPKNIKSRSVFEHLGFKEVRPREYIISGSKLIEWINNKK